MCIRDSNDTHPVLAIPEMMRVMLDECGYGWEDAWNIVRQTVAYTNHTVCLLYTSDPFGSKNLPKVFFETFIPACFLLTLSDRKLSNLPHLTLSGTAEPGACLLYTSRCV